MAALLRRGDVADRAAAERVAPSLRDDYEISWPEADVTVDTAVAAGALGARMMGGGFGGSVLALVPAASAAVRARCAPRSPTAAGHRPASWTRPRRPARGRCGDRHGCGARRHRRDRAGHRRAAHRIHREPEIGLDLPRTQEKVLAALDGLPLEITLGRALSSVTAVLRGGAARADRAAARRHGRAAGHRADRPGLRLAVTGVMHACGHDLHTAMLAGAARLLSARQRRAPRERDLHVPARRGGPLRRAAHDRGGRARRRRWPPGGGLCAARRLGPRHAAFATRPGPMMAAADVLDVTVRGAAGTPRSRTVRRPDPGRLRDRDRAADAGDQAVRRVRPGRHHRRQLPRRHGGQRHPGRGPVPGHGPLVLRGGPGPGAGGGSRLVTDIAAAHGLQASAEYVEGYPVTVNDAAEAAFAEPGGGGRVRQRPAQPEAAPVTGAEDFSFVLEQVPGAFIMLGACPADAGPGHGAGQPRRGRGLRRRGAGRRHHAAAELALRRLAAAPARLAARGWRRRPAWPGRPRRPRAARPVRPRSGHAPRPGAPRWPRVRPHAQVHAGDAVLAVHPGADRHGPAPESSATARAIRAAAADGA